MQERVVCSCGEDQVCPPSPTQHTETCDLLSTSTTAGRISNSINSRLTLLIAASLSAFLQGNCSVWSSGLSAPYHAHPHSFGFIPTRFFNNARKPRPVRFDQGFLETSGETLSSTSESSETLTQTSSSFDHPSHPERQSPESTVEIEVHVPTTRH
ncbi:hypothetical protein LZ554_002207 [Drepanopeziza brunnea f. sp. 'monogermtubi']|nr:hypothetical protein LZ554_002207 [Drepanopeziza brunnea f. sp. 'monogermtubi']